MDVSKIAKKDAFDWARAEMFFGAGAGTRRKLLNAAIEDKVAKIPGYVELFEEYYSKQNGKGLLTGNRRQLTTVVLTGVVVWGVLVETGYDEPIKKNVKQTYAKAKKAFQDKMASDG